MSLIDSTHNTHEKDIDLLGGIRIRYPNMRSVADPSLSPLDHWDRPFRIYAITYRRLNSSIARPRELLHLDNHMNRISTLKLILNRLTSSNVAENFLWTRSPPHHHHHHGPLTSEHCIMASVLKTLWSMHTFKHATFIWSASEGTTGRTGGSYENVPQHALRTDWCLLSWIRRGRQPINSHIVDFVTWVTVLLTYYVTNVYILALTTD
jgi:hypothetical protein